MSNKTDRDLMEETLQRVIRTETRLVTLGSEMGVSLKDDEHIEVNTETGVLTLATLDVPFTSVIKVARRAGLHGSKVTVMFDGKLIGVIPV